MIKVTWDTYPFLIEDWYMMRLLGMDISPDMAKAVIRQMRWY